MKVSIMKRVGVLEERLKPSEPDLPPFDFGLLTACEEEYFSLEMTVLRLKARELGYGDRNNKFSWSDFRGCDPVVDEDVRAECLAALNAEEAMVIETSDKIAEKCFRLTAMLSEEEKKEVRTYNGVVLYFQNSLVRNCSLNVYRAEDLSRARQRYEEIMARHGETIFEQPISNEAC